MEVFFDKRRTPKIKLRVKGRRQAVVIEAVLDTGFNGSLSIPISIAVPLGLELIGREPVEYADGRTSYELIFSVEVILDGKSKSVLTTLTGSSEALVGTALLNNYEVRLNFKTQKIVFLK